MWRVAFILILLAFTACDDTPTAQPAQRPAAKNRSTLPALTPDQARQITGGDVKLTRLYPARVKYLDGPTQRGYPVLAEVAVTAEKRADLLRAVQRHMYRLPDGIAETKGCISVFQPRHGIVADGFDVLVCFECDDSSLFDGTDIVKLPTFDDLQPTLDSLLPPVPDPADTAVLADADDLRLIQLAEPGDVTAGGRTWRVPTRSREALRDLLDAEVADGFGRTAAGDFGRELLGEEPDGPCSQTPDLALVGGTDVLLICTGCGFGEARLDGRLRLIDVGWPLIDVLRRPTVGPT